MLAGRKAMSKKKKSTQNRPDALPPYNNRPKSKARLSIEIYA